MDFEKSDYELQYYGFTLDELKSDTKLMAKLEVDSVIRETANVIIKKMYMSEEGAEKLINKCGIITDNAMEQFLGSFKQYEDIIDENFTIPDYVLLPEDRKQLVQYTEADVIEIQNHCDQLKNQFEQNIVMLNKLKVELGTYEANEEILNEEMNLIKMVESDLKVDFNLENEEAAINQLKEIILKKKTDD